MISGCFRCKTFDRMMGVIEEDGTPRDSEGIEHSVFIGLFMSNALSNQPGFLAAALHTIPPQTLNMTSPPLLYIPHCKNQPILLHPCTYTHTHTNGPTRPLYSKSISSNATTTKHHSSPTPPLTRSEPFQLTHAPQNVSYLQKSTTTQSQSRPPHQHSVKDRPFTEPNSNTTQHNTKASQRSLPISGKRHPFPPTHTHTHTCQNNHAYPEQNRKKPSILIIHKENGPKAPSCLYC